VRVLLLCGIGVCASIISGGIGRGGVGLQVLEEWDKFYRGESRETRACRTTSLGAVSGVLVCPPPPSQIHPHSCACRLSHEQHVSENWGMRVPQTWHVPSSCHTYPSPDFLDRGGQASTRSSGRSCRPLAAAHTATACDRPVPGAVPIRWHRCM
jgi:hypothetical protein